MLLSGIYEPVKNQSQTKRGCVFPMVIWPAFRMGQYRVNYHPYHAPQFTISQLGRWIPGCYYFDLYPIVLLYQMWLIELNPFSLFHQHVDLIEVWIFFFYFFENFFWKFFLKISKDHLPFHLTDKMLSIIITPTEHFRWKRCRTWWWIVAWSWILGP